MPDLEINPTDIVVLIHGIRTHGSWAEMVASELQSKMVDIKVVPIKYGYLDIFRFACPLLTRNKPINKVKRELRDLRTQYPSSNISVIAHSFGSYSIYKCLNERDIKLHRVIFCGSIIPDNFQRANYSSQLADDEILNDCGTHDIWPPLAKSLTWGYGSTGTFGFGTIGVKDRFNKYSHSDYFNKEFVATYWVPYLKSGEIVQTEWETNRNTPPLWQSLISNSFLKYILIALILFGVYQIGFKKDPLIPSPEPTPNTIIDVSKLLEMESKLEFEAVESQARFSTLKEYYKDSNSSILKTIESSIQSNDKKLIYIVGGAGWGKSFVYREMTLPPNSLRIKLHDAVKKLNDKIEKADLTATSHEQVIINKLWSVKSVAAFDFTDFLPANFNPNICPVLILDDLDEIHPELSNKLLQSLETAVRANSPLLPNTIIVFGRPEAYASWLSSSKRIPVGNKVVGPLTLTLPTYYTTGDIAFRFAEHRDVASTTEGAVNFVRFVKKHRFLSYSLSGLSVGNFSVQQSVIHSNDSELQLKSLIYDNMLQRNNESHKRPKDRLGIYTETLKKIGIKYAEKVDSNGYFSVNFTDSVQIDHNGQKYTFLVRDVLDRSGLVILNPVDLKTLHYRFEPFWLHRYLVECE